ncbi:hypothetical protein TcCL_ESM05965 [Trypanosoma cruzi]|nr:hypothetical protein TcCL_ESM05965 [Trypanosoma cruzi]
MALRALRRCGNLTFPVSRSRQKSHRNHRQALVRGRERKTAHRPHLRRRLHGSGRSHSLMQLTHGVVRKASRNRISSLAFPQARVPPTNRRRCQEYDGLTASTALECTYCEFGAQAKAGPPSRLRAHEHSSTEPRSAPKREALCKRF